MPQGLAEEWSWKKRECYRDQLRRWCKEEKLWKGESEEECSEGENGPDDGGSLPREVPHLRRLCENSLFDGIDYKRWILSDKAQDVDEKRVGK